MHGPYSGFDTLDDAIQALRRARFRVLRRHELPSRGVILEGEIVAGTVRTGMVVLDAHRAHQNVLVEVSVQAVEFMRHPGGSETVALVLGSATALRDVAFASGSILDILESSAVSQRAASQ